MENIWAYEVSFWAKGIVIAETKDEAERKVREAYKKHNSCFDEDTPIFIKAYNEDGGWFPDCPDVLEVADDGI